MVQGKISEADTPTVWLGATPSGLISDTHLPHLPILTLDALPATTSQFILAWDRHQICSLAYPVAWKIIVCKI